MKSGMPDLRTRMARFSPAIDPLPLSSSTGIWPERFKCQPMNGHFHKLCLARIRNWKGRLLKTSGVSMNEVWLEV